MGSKGQNHAPARGPQKSAEGRSTGKGKGECFAPHRDSPWSTCRLAVHRQPGHRQGTRRVGFWKFWKSWQILGKKYFFSIFHLRIFLVLRKFLGFTDCCRLLWPLGVYISRTKQESLQTSNSQTVRLGPLFVRLTPPWLLWKAKTVGKMCISFLWARLYRTPRRYDMH